MSIIFNGIKIHVNTLAISSFFVIISLCLSVAIQLFPNFQSTFSILDYGWIDFFEIMLQMWR